MARQFSSYQFRLFAYPEPSNCHLKMQKRHPRSFPEPKTNRNLSDGCLALKKTMIFCQDKHGYLKLVS
jgi:hypothetical protein